MTTTAKPRKRPATYADLEAVPPNMVAEILGGELVTHPRPRPRHGIASFALGGELSGPFQKGGGGGPGGWIFIDKPELHLGDNVVVPDIAGWRRERLPEMPEEVGITIPPDWVCEVLSPSTAIHDRTIKFDIYYTFGVGYLWYLDPEYKTLEVFGRGADHWQALRNFGGHVDVRAEPFDAISFSLGALWPYDPPPAAEGA
jgi:Uma2 family endonuclease